MTIRVPLFGCRDLLSCAPQKHNNTIEHWCHRMLLSRIKAKMSANQNDAFELACSNLRLKRAKIRRLKKTIEKLEDKILDKDGGIHGWWTMTGERDVRLAEKEEEIEEQREEIAALKAALEQMRASQEANLGGDEGEKSTERKRSQ
ncbi:hypothetical protein EAF04_007866 [Stromatinia cepivora]|nr:hypothetical protein EAF04_007866 [Stromatinia cepivora]